MNRICGAHECSTCGVVNDDFTGVRNVILSSFFIEFGPEAELLLQL